MTMWYESAKNTNDQIVVASRVRLARNLVDYPFSMKISDEQAQDLVNTVGEKFFSQYTGKTTYHYYALGEMDTNLKNAMAERYTITPLLRDKTQTCGLIVSEDESESIMVNEEDHLRIQSVSMGNNLWSVYLAADRMDDLLSERMPYAYNHKYGYITSCPTSMGTGLRATYILHLPFMEKQDLIRPLAEELNRLGCVLKSVYQDVNGTLASLYQISNQRTLGLSEEEILSSLKSIVEQVEAQERQAGEDLLRKNRSEIEDQVYRSYGILRYGRKFGAGEALTHLSNVRTGIALGMLKTVGEAPDMYTLMIHVLPSTLMRTEGRDMGSTARHACRAAYIHEKLPDIIE